jgi:site-specific DNA-methyltransferase (adenine-specific)
MTKDLRYLMKSTIIWNKNQIGNRTSWGSFKSPQNPSFPTPFEFIMIFCKDSQRKVGDKKDITVTKEEFIRSSLASWSFMPETRMNKIYKHPAMFPVELPHRLIQQLSYKGDVVLDIFSGMGTTCLAAAMLERQWIGFELSKDYVTRSRERIRQYFDQERLF